MTNTPEVSKSRFNFLKFYLTIVSIVGIIGTVVGFGMAIYQLLMGKIISDAEYLTGNYGYEVQNCTDPYYGNKYRAQPLPTTDGKNLPALSAEEIQKCEAETKTRVLNARRYNIKESSISGMVWGGLFFILFITHFPYFIRKNRD